MGCHFLLQCMKVKSESEVTQSCLTQRPHGLQPTRLLCPWDFPGKSTGVGCHCLLQKNLLRFPQIHSSFLCYFPGSTGNSRGIYLIRFSVLLTKQTTEISCLVSKLCLTLCNPMDCNMPGFPVLHCLPEFAQTHVH